MIPRNSCVGIRPLNCADENDEGKLCPRCKQYHLRPGYCQALDPVNAAKYPQFHPAKRNKVPSRHGADTVTLSDESVAGQEFPAETDGNKRNSMMLAVDDTPFSAASDALNVTHCIACGAPFHPERSSAKYCSVACRVSAHRKQKSPQ